MYAGTDFDQIEPGETDVFSIEFTKELGFGIEILTANWTASVDQTLQGSTPDASPQSRINGPAGIVTMGLRTFTSQTVNGMVDGNYYVVQATVTTSDGRTLQKYSRVLCRAPV